eukprot:TRINITY_DN50771_c0_g1_i1.p1 TRINITY_DN50771_c0_g1~~TRINITY_DN50771_c0_g1_i1.p1  ORF type:complete len:1325 (-),score=261.01 TRINITY_DN50771_c0_g1_i1:45-3818(-)
MDDFAQEHSQCYEFRDPNCVTKPHEDRYMQIFQALQKELCCLMWPPLSRKVSRGRARTLRVLQCLRLLTRDPEFQLALFDRESPRPFQEREGSLTAEHRDPRDERDMQLKEPTMRETRERGRERAVVPTLPVPAMSSRAPAPYPPTGHPAPPASSRPGVSASPRRTKYRSPEPRSQRTRCPSIDCADDAGTAQYPSHPGTRTGHSPPTLPGLGAEERGGDRGVRLPPLESPRRAAQKQLPDAALGSANPSTDALLRLLADLVSEYLADVEQGASQGGMHAADACAGAGMDTRLVIAVAGLCVAEIVGMLNRYASTQARQSRLAQLGALGPLARLLSGVSDPLVLRCALETLVHFTMHRNPAVLAELVQLCTRETPQVLPHIHAAAKTPVSSKHRSSNLLHHCLALLQCSEEMYQGLASQLLEQMLEAPELRQHLRQQGAVARVLCHLRVDSPDVSGEGRGASSSAPEGAAGAVSSLPAKKLIHVLGCCKKLARDHVDRGNQLAVQELLEQDTLSAMLQLVRLCSKLQDAAAAEVLVAALDTLAQMCMDDECAITFRLQHPDGLVAIGSLLLEESWSHDALQTVGDPVADGDSWKQATPLQDVQRAAARLLRFLFSVERNRKAFGQIFSSEILGRFVDIGNYVWPLEAYTSFVRFIVSLGERELAALRNRFSRCSEASRSRSQEPPGSETGSSPSGVPEGSKADWGGARRNVGGYELVECVGAGAFGRVHLARRADASGNFALKEVLLSPLSDAVVTPSGPSRCSTPRGQRGGAAAGDEAIAQDIVAKDISLEVRLLRQLDHPNVVQYYSSFTTGCGPSSTLWIVMEFCSGVALQGFTASAKEKGFLRLPEEQTWTIFVQICLALRYLHMDKGIAHRDLTPNNVLVQSHSLAVKVADFGLARQKAGAGAASASMMKSMVGTILYSSPEIVQHKPYTNKTDVWALGCLLFKMATLRDPFSGSNPLSVARKIVESAYDPLDEDENSAMLRETCQKCLTVDPDMRPDIQEVCQLITPALVRHLESAQRTIASQQASSTQVLSPPARQVTSPPAMAGLRLGALSPLWDDEAAGGPSARMAHSPADSPTLVNPAEQVVSPGSIPAPSPEESSRGKVQVPRRVLRNVVDPVQKALQVVHRLAFLAQLPEPPKEATGEEDASLAVHRYQQWLFSRPSNASLMKREVSRLMQRSLEPVECCGAGGEPPAPGSWGAAVAAMSLNYECLNEYVSRVSALHGYPRAAESASLAAPSAAAASSGASHGGS